MQGSELLIGGQIEADAQEAEEIGDGEQALGDVDGVHLDPEVAVGVEPVEGGEKLPLVRRARVRLRQLRPEGGRAHLLLGQVHLRQRVVLEEEGAQVDDVHGRVEDVLPRLQVLLHALDRDQADLVPNET